MNVPSNYTERDYEKYCDSPSDADIELIEILKGRNMTDIKQSELDKHDIAIAEGVKLINDTEDDFLTGVVCNAAAPEECESCQ